MYLLILSILPFLRFKGKNRESKLSASIHASLLPKYGCNVANSLTLLLPSSNHKSRKISPSLRCIVWGGSSNEEGNQYKYPVFELSYGLVFASTIVMTKKHVGRISVRATSWI